jgi:hypothetical protein
MPGIRLKERGGGRWYFCHKFVRGELNLKTKIHSEDFNAAFLKVGAVGPQGAVKISPGRLLNAIDLIYNTQYMILNAHIFVYDSLRGLVVRVPRYRPRGPEFDSLRYQIF